MEPGQGVATAPRVVIVDADRRVQASLSDLLSITDRVQVVGTAGDVRAALEIIERERPDAVLVDARLPDIAAGEAFITGMNRAWPTIRIVRTGWSDVEGHVTTEDEPCCYVSKAGSPEEFISAILDACC
ncbi:MAG: response regulator [Chloroflexi bacterium]|nr:response regulator [Chloroflexota bacterium]